jgi:hypothetical protein
VEFQRPGNSSRYDWLSRRIPEGGTRQELRGRNKWEQTGAMAVIPGLKNPYFTPALQTR